MAAGSPEEIDSLFDEAMTRGDLDGAMSLYETGAVYSPVASE